MSNRLTKHLCMAALLSLLALTTSASAQQQPQANPDANITTESFQDWEVRCQSGASDRGACAMAQMVSDADNGQPLLQVVLNYPPELNGPAMSFLLPLGVRLAPGLQLSVDGREPIQFPYQVCQQGAAVPTCRSSRHCCNSFAVAPPRPSACSGHAETAWIWTSP
jgi:invasion protein IalB